MDTLVTLPDLGPVVAAARAAGLPLPSDLDCPLEPTPGSSSQSFHLTMRDGVRIAVDLHLPPLVAGNRVPTCLRSTRYWRAAVGDPVKEHLGALEAARWTAEGFALVVVDTRGTGASFGSWPCGWNDDQRDDLFEIVDWVVAQWWSDGSVGGYGTSYDGTAAQLLAATGHPAVTAIVPRYSLYDSYRDISAPGGIPLDGFTLAWAAVNWTLDGHPDRATVPLPLPISGCVRPVDGPHGEGLLAAAVADHARNWDLARTAAHATCREEGLSEDGQPLDDVTPAGRIDALRRHRVPTWLWSAWYDGAYAAAQLVQLADPGLDVRVTIGPGGHGGSARSLGDPLRPDETAPSMGTQVAEIAAFLRSRGPSGGLDPSPERLRYYRLGDGWRTADSWPPAGVTMQRWWLGAEGAMVSAPGSGARQHRVDPLASTGVTGTRWATLLGGAPVLYPDRREADVPLLCWDGPVLSEATGVTGSPVVHLEITTSTPDADVFAYLEAVAPDGSVLYLTEGCLRLSDRAVEGPESPYAVLGPSHSHSRHDRSPLSPGEVCKAELMLQPISALVPAGRRLRLAISGADAPTFRRIESAPSEVVLEVGAASWIDIPVDAG